MVVSATGLGELRNVVGTPIDRDRLRTVGSRELYVEKTGAGPAVVLVHGLGGATTVYEPQVAALAETHTVIRYDLSGHGLSPVVGPNSIESWVEELKDLIDSEGLDKVALVAHSMGTLVVTTFAATYPDRVTRVALLGPVRAQAEQAKTATRGRARAVREGGMSAVADTVVGAALSEQTRAAAARRRGRSPRAAARTEPGRLRLRL